MAEDILTALERIAPMKSELDADRELMERAAREIRRLRKQAAKQDDDRRGD